MNKVEIIENIYRSLAEPILSEPEKMLFQIAATRNLVTITVDVTGTDYGKLIGRHGATFKAFERTIGLLVQRSGYKRLFYTIPKFTRGRERPHMRFSHDKEWSSNWVVDLLKRTLDTICSDDIEVQATDCTPITILSAKLPNEYADVVEHLQDDLSVIFWAIGKANGRNIEMEITQ